MTNLTKIKQQTNNPYFNLFEATFDYENKTINYYFASRKNIDSLALKTKKVVCDSARVIPYFKDKKTGEISVVLIKEFRYPIGDWIYSVPAGLIDEGETPFETCKRELLEEIGGEALSVVQTEKAGYILAGMTDESTASFEAEVALTQKQNLGEKEQIVPTIVKLSELNSFLDNNNISILSLYQLRSFYYKQKYVELFNQTMNNKK